MLTIGQRSYLFKELMPTQDRLRLEHWNGKLRRLEKVMRAMGHLVAWGHLRGGGRQGSATADEWVAFGSETGWRQPLLDYAIDYSRRVSGDWQHFAKAFDQGLLE